VHRGVAQLFLACCLVGVLGPANKTCFATPRPQQASSAGSESATATETSQQDSGSTQVTSVSQPDQQEYDNTLDKHVFKDFFKDQKAIWTSPFHVRLVDAEWLVPLGGAAAAMFATDTEVSKHLSNSPSRISTSNSLSDYGIASLAAAAGGMYVWGHFTHNDHMRETGFLAGEAAADSLAATYALKYALGRERPLQDNFQGQFWHGGDSFPSEHSSAAWSIASVIAHEYPGPLTSVVSYGLAAAIGAARVTGKDHFPSDVLVGSALGWFIGQEVYRHHHDPTLGGGDWETYAEAHEDDSATQNSTASQGSPYVELDSWIYPAIEKLAALGYIRSAYLDMRPWTRIECANLVEEAGDQIRAEPSVATDVEKLYGDLESEFRRDLDATAGGSERSLRLESIYSNVTGISGKPLNDSYHFGQTIINNYGRPYQEGFNTYDGFSGYGTAGRFTVYVRGEFQHAPSAPAYPLSAREAISAVDQNPLQPAVPFANASKFTLLDTYVAANVAGFDLAFGKQSLWWGPGDGGDLLFSNNAEPIYMFRASRVNPFVLPWIFHWLGPVKTDAFFGKLSGNQFPPRPLFHGEKLSIKPTENFELSITRTAEFGGVGRPLTLGAIWNSYFVFNQSSVIYSAYKNPGKRTGGINFSYRVPFIRNWLTVYANSLSADDPSPLSNPPRAAWNPGFYMPQIPGLRRLDFRVEAVNSNLPLAERVTVYWETFYHDLYTDKNNILGSWIGRSGLGLQGWSTYSFGPRTSLQFGYRQAKVAKDFIPNGETLHDGSVKINWRPRRDISVSGLVQYEKWLAPVLAPGPQTNWTTSVEIAFFPHSWVW
jgi:Capsule assembly protein Wzi/PAP2 superfamily